MQALHRHAKTAYKEMAAGATTPPQAAAAAVLFAAALLPLACCPAAAPPASALRAPPAAPAEAPWWRIALCIAPHPAADGGRGSAAAPDAAAAAAQLGQVIARLQHRALSVAEWLERGLGPAALRALSLRQLDDFLTALQAAAGDETLQARSVSPARLALWRCAAQALAEAAWRVRQPKGALCAASSLDAPRARRMAAAGRRSWEAALVADPPRVADVASAVAALEAFVAAKEDEEQRAVTAAMAAAVAAARR
jgi:hypothetical protein